MPVRPLPAGLTIPGLWKELPRSCAAGSAWGTPWPGWTYRLPPKELGCVVGQGRQVRAFLRSRRLVGSAPAHRI